MGVDTERTVRYRWVTDDASDQLDLQPVLDAVRQLDAVDDDQITGYRSRPVRTSGGPGNLDTGEEQDE